MSIERINSSDVQVFVNTIADGRLPAINSLSISTNKQVSEIRRLGDLNVSERILGSNQTTTLSMDIMLTTGATGIDPFYSFFLNKPYNKGDQAIHFGFLNTGKIDFTIKDLAGQTDILDSSVVNYSLNGSVGDLVRGAATYEGNAASFRPAGALERKDQTNDSFGGFFRPEDIEITTTTNGDEGIDTASLNIQDFSLSVNTPRIPKTRLGTRTPRFRYPELPAAGDLSFTVLKTEVTGVNLSSLVCQSGVIKIDLKGDNDTSVMDFSISGCCLETVDESTSLDDNTSVTFSYYFPILQ